MENGQEQTLVLGGKQKITSVSTWRKKNEFLERRRDGDQNNKGKKKHELLILVRRCRQIFKEPCVAASAVALTSIKP
jgi:hypothetical protein